MLAVTAWKIDEAISGSFERLLVGGAACTLAIAFAALLLMPTQRTGGFLRIRRWTGTASKGENDQKPHHITAVEWELVRDQGQHVYRRRKRTRMLSDLSPRCTLGGLAEPAESELLCRPCRPRLFGPPPHLPPPPEVEGRDRR